MLRNQPIVGTALVSRLDVEGDKMSIIELDERITELLADIKRIQEIADKAKVTFDRLKAEGK